MLCEHALGVVEKQCTRTSRTPHRNSRSSHLLSLQLIDCTHLHLLSVFNILVVGIKVGAAADTTQIQSGVSVAVLDMSCSSRANCLRHDTNAQYTWRRPDWQT